MAIERILRAVEERPWMLHPPKAREVAEVLAAKANTGQIPTPSEAAQLEAEYVAAARQGRMAPAGGGNQIAVINLFGTIAKRISGLDAMSGGASLVGFSRAFDEAMADDAVGKIVIVVDSPGGSVYGVEDVFQKVFAARGDKEVVAVADGLCASAAYYIASAASELVVSPSGEVGSIGVYMIHFDWSENVAESGIKPTIIKYGDNKAEGNPFEALSDKTYEHYLALCSDYGRQFERAVAKGRGVSPKIVRDSFGQGRTYTASRALELGMVDRVATLDDVLAEMQGKKSRPRSSRRADADHQIAARLFDGAAEPDDCDLAACATGVADALASAIPGESVMARSLRTLDEVEFALAARRHRDAGLVPTADHPTDAVQGHAATTDSQDSPAQPAPEAKGEPMSDVTKTDTAAQPATGAAQEAQEEARAAARAEERKRVQEIMSIGEEHELSAETVQGWINAGTSTDAVRAQALEIIRERAKAAPVVRVGDDREAKQGFQSFGEQLIAIYNAGQRGGSGPDKRLLGINAAATGAGESVPSDGGFLIQPEFTDDILRRVYEMGQVASRVRRRPIGPNSNGMKLKAIDETSRANGSRWGGVQAYWADEADTVTATKPKFRTMELSLHKLMGLMYSTEELLEDAVALQGVAEDAFAEEINFKVEDAIFRGTGAGQPLGVLNSSCLVTVSKESAQTADTINATNVTKMFGRLWPRSRMNSAWFINVDAEHQLPLMTIGDQPIYLPPGGLRDSPFGSLLGRPVIPVEYADTVGNLGDICLFDLDQYLMIDKGGAKQAWSIHVRFIYDEQTFKITYRCDGQPLWNQALTPFKGTNTLSPFVVLEAR